MNLLLRHFEDDSWPRLANQPFDLIVELGQVPTSDVRRMNGERICPTISIYDFAEEVEDLHYLRKLVEVGMDQWVDQAGIDWWSVLSAEILPELQQLMLIQRLAKYVNQRCNIYASRSDYRCVALHKLLGGELIVTDSTIRTNFRRLRHYAQLSKKFGFRDVFQIAQDKFDSQHAIRSKFFRRKAPSDRAVILLPSAYSNVTRTALAYAAMLPQEQFLLVCTRDSARAQQLPSNVEMISLDPYFAPSNPADNQSLLKSWENLKNYLIRSSQEYEAGAASGLFSRIPKLLDWGIAIRDAWVRLFHSVRITSCFCADHTNTYTRLPLLLAKHAGAGTTACHHGALDWGMAVTAHDADGYIAKSAMERDYMERVCGINTAKILDVPPGGRARSYPRSEDLKGRSWLVFFSEPYNLWSWRADEVYKDLLPRLITVAQKAGWKVVFKLHPFESARSHRQLLLRHMPREKAREIDILTGPIKDELWKHACVALTAQSSVALECEARGIPIFLCAWLRDPFSGYMGQYQKFGVGYRLETAAEISEIPHLMAAPRSKSAASLRVPSPTDFERFKELLTTSRSLTATAHF